MVNSWLFVVKCVIVFRFISACSSLCLKYPIFLGNFPSVEVLTIFWGILRLCDLIFPKKSLSSKFLSEEVFPAERSLSFEPNFPKGIITLLTIPLEKK